MSPDDHPARSPERWPLDSTTSNSSSHLRWLPRLGGVCLAVLLCVLTFLLACNGLTDADFWWQLRAGEWIVDNYKVPDNDPFTFGSADQKWIDLHWLFQICLALTHRLGGIQAVIVGQALVATASVVAGLACRRAGTSLTLTVLCWLPVLFVLGVRFRPRPEMFSLLFLATYLAILTRLYDRPRLAWLLPVIQLAWVNSHGLFILGPIVLTLWLLVRIGFALKEYRATGTYLTPERRRWWRHVGGATILVGVACFLNPYGIDGVLFPFVLFPKVTDPANPYKKYVGEFGTAANYCQHQLSILINGSLAGILDGFCLRFLLVVVPLSFVFPAAAGLARHQAERKKTAGPTPDPVNPSNAAPRAWLAGLLLCTLLAAVNASLVFGKRNPEWLADFAAAVPYLFLVGGIGLGVVHWRRSDPAASLLFASGIAAACWVWWLDGFFSSGSQEVPELGLTGFVFVVAGGYAIHRYVRGGCDPFPLLLVGAFGYLALNAITNAARFGLVSGVVLVWNLGPWLSDTLATLPPTTSWRRLRVGVSVAVGSLLSGWVVWASVGVSWLPGGAYSFAEADRLFAHDAARFAGQEGMPERALVYDVYAADVYVYHNAPARKAFMDARLEVPTLATFQKYLAIEELFKNGKPEWARALAEMGNPLLLLTHNRYSLGEEAVLAHPNWRLVYYDAQAAVFLPVGSAELESRFPNFDFAARHFEAIDSPSVPNQPWAAEEEALALVKLGTAMHDPKLTWTVRVPALLSGLDRAAMALISRPTGGVWWAVGSACWGLSVEVPRRQKTGIGWEVTTGLRWAQHTYALRQALIASPGDSRLLYDQYRSFWAREMYDCLPAMGRKLLTMEGVPDEQLTTIRKHLEAAERLSVVDRGPPGDEQGYVMRLLQRGRPEEAMRFVESLGDATSNWRWEVVDVVATCYLQLGHPGKARLVWERARVVPSETVRLARIAATCWVERDLQRALQKYRQAQEAGFTSGELTWSLAWLHAEMGDAAQAIDAIDHAPAKLPDELRKELDDLRAFLRRYDKRRR